jgi:ABC-type glycerol-3-phosphate transport system substrate-binding protein
VASLDLSMLQEMAASGTLVDRNPMIQATGYDLSAYYQSTLEMFQNNGGQFGLPASYSNVVMY